MLRTESGGIIMNVTAPETVRRFDDVTLHCDYRVDGNGDRLYALRWFHNSVPVIRYSPLLQPQIRGAAASRTLRVNLASSSGKRLHLDAVDWNVTGIWTCQIMAEAPSFETMEASTHLKVIGQITSLYSHFLSVSIIFTIFDKILNNRITFSIWLFAIS